MTDVDRRITNPHFDETFLKWYEGIFESVFIALHPFVKIEGVDPSAGPRPVLVLDRSDIPDERLSMDLIDKLQADYRAQFPIALRDLENMEKQSGTSLPWNEIKKGCGIDSIAHINSALLTTIMAIYEKPEHVERAQQLEEYCSASGIFLPTHDNVPPILESKVLKLLQGLGCEDVFLADEFNSKIESHKYVDLDTKTCWTDPGSVGFRFSKLYPADHSFLVIVPFDTFYSVICGNPTALKSAGVDELFDGFWCDEKTRPSWWCQSTHKDNN